ncbi:TPA: hypothetical protein ACPYU1_004049 [Raoultella planticola]
MSELVVNHYPRRRRGLPARLAGKLIAMIIPFCRQLRVMAQSGFYFGDNAREKFVEGYRGHYHLLLEGLFTIKMRMIIIS